MPNFYAAIRFQPFQYYPQTPWQKGIAAEGKKTSPARIGCSQGGVLSAHSAFQDLTIELLYSPWWVYILTILELYAHR
ncbi:hypothetical protein, partial [Bacteroides acidifaciens]|uniref:hypothetical protein n=1 Tax=Bacteroides acidifaciens TaxID=85831 RepID=UPI0030138A80